MKKIVNPKSYENKTCLFRGFTLVEILVVISIIGLLMGILMPSLNLARKQARKVKCAANMRQIALAFRLYASDWDDKIIIAKEIMQNVDGQRPWNFALMPYIGQECKTVSFDKKVNLWFCPEDKDPFPTGFGNYSHEDAGLTSYALNGYYEKSKNVRLGPAGGYEFSRIPSPSACMLIAETSHSGQIYDAQNPRAIELGLTTTGRKGRSHHRRTSGFYHDNSMNVAFVDGHVGNIKGRKAETVVWPEDNTEDYKSGNYMFWPTLTLPSSAQDNLLWGPGYTNKPSAQ